MSTRRQLSEILDTLPDARLAEVLDFAKLVSAKEGRPCWRPGRRHAALAARATTSTADDSARLDCIRPETD